MSPFFHKNVIDNFFTPFRGALPPRSSTLQIGFSSRNVAPPPTRTRNVLKPTSPFVSKLYVRSCNARSEGSACSNMKTGAHPLTWKCCYPLPAGPPSCGFPPKSFPLKREPTISGDTFGTRARGRPRSAPLRRRHVMPLAMRPLREKSGALLAHVPSALGTHTVAADFQEAASRL